MRSSFYTLSYAFGDKVLAKNSSQNVWIFLILLITFQKRDHFTVGTWQPSYPDAWLYKGDSHIRVVSLPKHLSLCSPLLSIPFYQRWILLWGLVFFWIIKVLLEFWIILCVLNVSTVTSVMIDNNYAVPASLIIIKSNNDLSILPFQESCISSKWCHLLFLYLTWSRSAITVRSYIMNNLWGIQTDS